MPNGARILTSSQPFTLVGSGIKPMVGHQQRAWSRSCAPWARERRQVWEDLHEMHSSSAAIPPHEGGPSVDQGAVAPLDLAGGLVAGSACRIGP
jgi:hypothetical protein